MIPSRLTVLLGAALLALSLAATADPTLGPLVLWADLALAGVAALDALLTLRPLVDVQREAPGTFSVGRTNAVTVEVRSRARRSLKLQVNDDLFEGSTSDLPLSLTLRPRGRLRAQYRVRPELRGAHVLGDHYVRYSSPLGLWVRQLRIPASTPVRVYPDLKAVRSYELLARRDRAAALRRANRLRGGENEFERLRDYTRDDEFRRIDWKATARRQRLIAREYQLERNQNLLFALDCGRLMSGESGGLSRLDHALNAVLMLSHIAVELGDQVGLLAFDAQVGKLLQPLGGRRAEQRMIHACYSLTPKLVEPDFGAAFDRLASRVRRRTLVILFTQVVDDVGARELTRRVRALMPQHLPLVVMLRDDDLHALAQSPHHAADAPSSQRADLGFYVRGAAAEAVVWRARLLKDLEAGGVLTLDCSPADVTAATVNRYLDIKARQLL
jgi:uncharacterized protein (DUF58 family)